MGRSSASLYGFGRNSARFGPRAAVGRSFIEKVHLIYELNFRTLVLDFQNLSIIFEVIWAQN